MIKQGRFSGLKSINGEKEYQNNEKGYQFSRVLKCISGVVKAKENKHLRGSNKSKGISTELNPLKTKSDQS